MRWVAGHANRLRLFGSLCCVRRRGAGVLPHELEALRRGDYSTTSTAQKHALEFAKKMTVDSAGVTDAEFAELVKRMTSGKPRRWFC